MTKLINTTAQYFGPFLFVLILLLPLELETNQQYFLAIFTFVIMNWLLTKTPLYITGFIGVGLSVLMGVSTAKAALAPFSSPIVFLFLGGFLFAKAMNESQLDKRISLNLLSQNFLNGSFKRMIVALITLTAFFSMWVSNTATTAMMLPIVLGIFSSLNIKDRNITTVILLGIAYAASIGGLATPIGSIPNIISIGLLAETANIDISFIQWISFGFPITFIFLIILCFYIFKKIPDTITQFDNKFIKDELTRFPKMTKNEKYILFLFLLTIFFWFFPSLLKIVLGTQNEIVKFVSNRFNSGVVSIFFASFLFIFPLKTSSKILTQNDIKKIDWPSLLLFGTGLSLGKILFDTGLAEIIGNGVLDFFSTSSFIVLLFVLVYFTIFSTEIASNTATASILLPIIIAMSISLDKPAEIFTIAVALACSLAFMLPVATPPNAIVYGSEQVEMKDMIKLGFKLNIIFGAILILGFYLGYLVFFS